jgi:hypothetical protein
MCFENEITHAAKTPSVKSVLVKVHKLGLAIFWIVEPRCLSCSSRVGDMDGPNFFCVSLFCQK